MNIKVMTYNICSGRDFSKDEYITEEGDSRFNLNASAEVIKGVNPDVCGINEINILKSDFVKKANGFTVENQPQYIAEKTGLTNYCFGRTISIARGDYGNAIISKHKMTASNYVEIPDPTVLDEQPWYETRGISVAEIELAGGITFLQTHAGLNVSEKQNAVKTLLELLDRIEGPVILMGDFNMRPADWIIGKLSERLQNITPDGVGYIHTYPSWGENDNIPRQLMEHQFKCKIDYIFASHHFKKLSCKVLDVRVSDHKPMVAELEI